MRMRGLILATAALGALASGPALADACFRGDGPLVMEASALPVLPAMRGTAAATGGTPILALGPTPGAGAAGGDDECWALLVRPGTPDRFA